jgi:hypothetical protein
MLLYSCTDNAGTTGALYTMTVLPESQLTPEQAEIAETKYNLDEIKTHFTNEQLEKLYNGAKFEELDNQEEVSQPETPVGVVDFTQQI